MRGGLAKHGLIASEKRISVNTLPNATDLKSLEREECDLFSSTRK